MPVELSVEVQRHCRKPNAPFPPHFSEADQDVARKNTTTEVQLSTCDRIHRPQTSGQTEENADVPVVVSRWCKPGHHPEMHYQGQRRSDAQIVRPPSTTRMSMYSPALAFSVSSAMSTAKLKTLQQSKMLASLSELIHPMLLTFLLHWTRLRAIAMRSPSPFAQVTLSLDQRLVPMKLSHLIAATAALALVKSTVASKQRPQKTPSFQFSDCVSVMMVVQTPNQSSMVLKPKLLLTT